MKQHQSFLVLGICCLFASNLAQENLAIARAPDSTNASMRDVGKVVPELSFFRCNPDAHCRSLNSGIDEQPRQEHPCIITQCANISAIKAAGNWEALRHRLIQVCKEVGAPVKIFSGYRTPAHNKCVGSKSGSRHLRKDAVDFFIDAPSHKVTRAMCRLPGGRGGPYKDGSYHLDLARTRAWTRGMTSMCQKVAVKSPDPIYRENRKQYVERMRSQQKFGFPLSLEAVGKDWFKKQPALSDRYEMRQRNSAPKDSGSTLFTLVGDYYINGIRRMDGKYEFAPSANMFVRFLRKIESAFAAYATSDSLEEDPFKKKIVNPEPPRLCRAATTMGSGFCDQNYSFANAAMECLYRVNEAELIGGLAVQDRVVKNGQRKQSLNFRDSSYDYKVAEAVSLRFRGILKRAIADVSSYSTKLMPLVDAEGTDPADMGCWHTTQNDIASVLHNLRQRLKQSEVSVKATSFLKNETKIRLENIEGVAISALSEVEDHSHHGHDHDHDHDHDQAHHNNSDPHLPELESEIDNEFRASMGL